MPLSGITEQDRNTETVMFKTSQIAIRLSKMMAYKEEDMDHPVLNEGEKSLQSI